MDNKDYATFTPQELRSEEKKIKRLEITSRVLIGFLLGVMIYSVAKNGLSFLPVFIPILLILGIVKNSQALQKKLRAIQAEIDAQSTGQKA